MNDNGSENRKRDIEREEELYRKGDVRGPYLNWLREMDRQYTALGRRAETTTHNITLGYVTTDVSEKHYISKKSMAQLSSA